MKIEKERKFLMKNFPNNKPDKILLITQKYDSEGYRYRETLTFNNDIPEYVHEKIKKVKVDKGINHETEIETISREQYLKAKCDKTISKERHIFNYEGKVFELDHFYRNSLIILEVENVDIDEEINFPDFLKKRILIEVTGMPEFDNINLAS